MGRGKFDWISSLMFGERDHFGDKGRHRLDIVPNVQQMSAQCGHPLLPITRSEASDGAAASGRCLLADSNLSPAGTSTVPDLRECH